MTEYGDITELGYAGSNVVAIGECVTMSQPVNSSILMGCNTNEKGTNNIIMGTSSTAIGNDNIVIGINTIVTGNNNYVVGHNLILTGNNMYYVHQQIICKSRKYLKKYLPQELVEMIILKNT